MTGDASGSGASLDALVVLGAAFRADGTASPALVRRARHAARLYHAGRAPAVLVTGGANPPGAPESEASAMFRILVRDGVPAERVLVEDRARNTAENARLSAGLLHARGWLRVGLVTDRPHVPRAALAFRREGMTVVAAPVPDTPRSLAPWVREMAAYWLYRIRYAMGSDSAK